MNQAYSIAKEISAKAAMQGKQQADKKSQKLCTAPGDQVLVKNMSPNKGPSKLRAYWEQDIYKVAKRHGEDSPVYTIKPRDKVGRLRTILRNLLLPGPEIQTEKELYPQPVNSGIKERTNHQKLHKPENGRIGESQGLLSENDDEFPTIEFDPNDHFRFVQEQNREKEHFREHHSQGTAQPRDTAAK